MLVVSAVLDAMAGSPFCALPLSVLLRSVLIVFSVVPAVPVVAARSLASARCSAESAASWSEVVAPLCVVLEIPDESAFVADEPEETESEETSPVPEMLVDDVVASLDDPC